ncbi:MAG TPA: outer membrane protein [Chthoniobacterales bacterium]|nr:outer membrane protein [Chthoniobacterales bacterium]
MKQLIRLTILFCTCAALALTALAGPEPLSSGKEMKQVAPAPPECDYTWTGFYIGARAGYGWDAGEIHAEGLPPAGFTIDPGHDDLNADGFVGGGELGFNWQLGKWFVLGAEGDFSGSDMSGTATTGQNVPQTAFNPAILRASQDINWIGTVRGRVGFVPWCRMLIYGTGGFAFADVDDAAILDFRPSGGTAFYPTSRSDTQSGWTAGGGLEFAISHHWSIKAEYLYFDLGDRSRTALEQGAVGPFSVHYKWDTQFHMVSGGLNFKF